ncbi:12026_t:CDS:2 [Ambispora leptoticha]|uniref:12026_t:CDS:1 n=1 Tax=Ambispora leptoticha TaxID=144679 RepID=A0A9N8Z3C4_9GLOM|nr:12026_t:CDS:2 [Ambispora leptoticha]
MHESGKKHKENVEKFLRNIYRREEETKKEDDKVKRELQRIERAAMKQYKKDVGLAETGASLNTLRSAIDNAVANAPPPSTDEREAYYKTSLPSSSALYYSDTTTVTAQLESDSSTLVTSLEISEVTAEEDSQIAIIDAPNKPEDRDTTAASSKQEGKFDDKTNRDYIPSIEEYEEEEEDDPDNLLNFKVIEKTLPINNDAIADEKVILKKRKIGKEGKQPKKIRKKSYD